MSEWISVKDRLPSVEDCEGKHTFAFVIVSVLDMGCTWSEFGGFPEPYDRAFVTSASFDTEQKIWDVCGCQLNALIPIEDAPTHGLYVTHWIPLPDPPKQE